MLAALLAGCAGGPEEVPGQDEAVAQIWAGYHAYGAPPTIVWRRGADLDCAQGRGWMEITLVHGAESKICVAGATWDQAWMSMVALPEGVPFSKTALAHEICHGAQIQQGLGPDYDHAGPCFVPGGPVEQANAALAAEGE